MRQKCVKSIRSACAVNRYGLHIKQNERRNNTEITSMGGCIGIWYRVDAIVDATLFSRRIRFVQLGVRKHIGSSDMQYHLFFHFPSILARTDSFVLCKVLMRFVIVATAWTTEIPFFFLFLLCTSFRRGNCVLFWTVESAFSFFSIWPGDYGAREHTMALQCMTCFNLFNWIIDETQALSRVI